MTISRAQEYSSSRSRAFFKLTTDQVLAFYWIAGSCQVNLLKTGQDCWEIVRKPVNASLGLKFIITILFSSTNVFFIAGLVVFSVTPFKIDQNKK